MASILNYYTVQGEQAFFIVFHMQNMMRLHINSFFYETLRDSEMESAAL